MSFPLPSLSVVVPVRNEAANIDLLASEITAALGCLDEWECIWVDDASTDGTAERLQRVTSRDRRHRVLTFGEHRGQTAALLAGWRAAGGEFVAGLDGDRQNDPADLPHLLRFAIERGLDMVNGVRTQRRDTFVRRLSGRIGNAFRNWLTGDTTTDVGCSTRVLRRTLVEEIPPFNGMHRFLPVLVRLAGGRVGEAPVCHRPRLAGESKYGIWDRLWVGIVDCLAVRWIAARRVRLETNGEAASAMAAGAASETAAGAAASAAAAGAAAPVAAAGAGPGAAAPRPWTASATLAGAAPTDAARSARWRSAGRSIEVRVECGLD